MRGKIIYFFFIFWIGATGQNKTIDSLKRCLVKGRKDTVQLNCLNRLCASLQPKGEFDSSLMYGNRAVELALSLEKEFNQPQSVINFSAKYLRAHALFNIASVYRQQGNYDMALENLFKSQKVYEELSLLPEKSKALKGEKGIASCLCSIGLCYYSRGDYSKALDNFFRSLKLDEALGNESGAAMNLGNIGLVYYEQKDFKKVLEYYFKSLKINEASKNLKGIATNLGNIGIAYCSLGDYEKALEYDLRALKMYEDRGNKSGIARNLCNIAIVYYNMAKQIKKKSGDSAILLTEFKTNCGKALDYFFQSLKVNEELGRKNGIVISTGNIGSIFIDLKKYDESEKYLLRSLNLSDSIGDLLGEMEAHVNLSVLYTLEGNYKKALEHFKSQVVLKDSLFNEEKNKELTKSEMNYEFEKKELAAKAIQEKKDAVTKAEAKKQETVLALVCCVLILVFVFSGFIFRSLRITRRQKVLIELKNKETEEQKKVIEEKNKDILDSIQYAKRIQQSLMPSNQYIERNLEKLKNA